MIFEFYQIPLITAQIGNKIKYPWTTFTIKLSNPNKCQNTRGQGQTISNSKPCTISTSVWKEAENSNRRSDEAQKITHSQWVLTGKHSQPTGEKQL